MVFGFGKKNTAKATIRIKAETNAAKRGIRGLDNNVKNMNKSFKASKTSLGLAGAAVAALTITLIKAKQALNFVTNSNVKFEAAGAKLRAILKPTGEEFKALEKLALQLGETTVFTASQVTESFIEMGKLGLETNEILASGNEVLALAALAQVEMATAASITVQTLNQFQLSATEAGRVVDVIAESFTSSALDITKFSEAMKFIGPIAGQTDESLEDVTGALSVLADNAVETSLAGTGMRTVLLELANENSKVSKAIRATGKEAGNFVDKLKILRDMELSLTETTEFFNKRAVTSALIVIKNADAVEELSEQYENADGAAEAMAKTMLDSVEGASIRLKSAQEGLALSIKEALVPALQAWNEWLIKVTLSAKDIPEIFASMFSIRTNIINDFIIELDKINDLEASTIKILREKAQIEKQIFDIQTQLLDPNIEEVFQKKIILGIQQEKLKEIEKELKIEEKAAEERVQRRLLDKKAQIEENIARQEGLIFDSENVKSDQQIIDLEKEKLKLINERLDAEMEIKKTTGFTKKEEKEFEEDKPRGLTDKEKKDAAKKARELEKAKLENGRKSLEIDEFFRDEETKAREEAFLEFQEIDENNAALEDERERERWANTQEIEAEARIALLGNRQAAFEDWLKELERMHERELLTDEAFLTARALAVKENEEQIKKEKIENAEEAFGALSTINGALMSMIDARTDREINNLEKQGLSEEEFEEKKEKLLKEGEEKRRAFARVQQGIAIAEATISAIKAGTGALADTPGGAFTRILSMGAAIAAGLAQVVTIQSQNFQTGRIGDSRRGRQADDIAAMIGQGETIIPAPQSAAHEDTLRAIMNNTANTSAGVRSMSGGGDTIQIFGASNEQILQVINAKERKRSTGLRI